MRSEPELVSRRFHFDRETKSVNDYFLMPFDVGEATAEVRVRYNYELGSDTDPNVIDLGLIGPGRTDFLGTRSFKGWSGSNKREIFVSRDSASPSYYPGRILAGRWQVLLGLYKISEVGCTCEVQVALGKVVTETGSNSAVPAAVPVSEPVVANPEWLKGDLHVHSHHSDGELSVESVVKEVQRRGLDYVAITDHNTTSQWREVAQLARPGPTVIVGEELTSYYGHANVWNTSEWLDFRMRSQEDARAVIDEAHRRGLLFSINHPSSLWPWNFREAQGFDCMEVWSGLWFAMNAGSLQWWDALAGEGKRVTAVGGSDFHKLEEPGAADIFSVGTPTTWVFSRDRSPSGIVDGIRSGRVFISRGPTGPRLTLTGENGRGTESMGGEMICMKGEEISLRVDARGAKGLGLRVCSDEGYCDALMVDADEWSHVIRTTARERGYYRAELVERDGDWRSAPPSDIEMASLTNHLHVRTE
jgi:hypothetical protein